MNKLQMPAKGNSAAMMAELQAEHAKAQATNEETNVTTLQPANEDTNVATSAATATAPAPPTTPTRDDRLTFALARTATDDMTVVTVRVSASLNHYMDEYVARRRSVDPKPKYRKQDAIAEAFAAFYADHPLPALPEDGDALL